MSAGTEERYAEEIAAEVVHTRNTVRALGEAIRAAHVPATPALAASTQARENLYERIAAEFGLLTSTQAGEAMGSRSSSATRNLAIKARREGRVVGLKRGTYTVFPGFQFTEAGLRPVVAELIKIGDAHGRTEAGLVQWLMTPTTYLHGRRPVDVVDEPEALLGAAHSSFGVDW